jgi:hypothetical protein
MQTFDLPQTTHALQLVRCGKEAFVYYEAVTFPNGPRAICDMYLRRASICGKIGEGVASAYTMDILDEDGDTLIELPIERKAARYLIEKLRLRVRRD